MSSSKLVLFGDTIPWTSSTVRWIPTNDSVRGGSSTSDLSPVPNTSQACFSGVLDTTTLGGAGFASQTATPSEPWDLSSYDGIQVEVVKGDGKKYTLIAKDEVPAEKREDGREKSSVNWEYDFVAGVDKSTIWVPWSSFKAVYRGVEKPDAAPLKIGEIQRIALMFRSFFGKQEGDFDLILASISAIKK